MTDSPKFLQVSVPEPWPSNREKAAGHLRLGPEALTARARLTFRTGSDDLDTFQDAALRLASGRRVLLLSRPPHDYGIDVLIDLADDAMLAMRELQAALNLKQEEFDVYVPGS